MGVWHGAQALLGHGQEALAEPLNNIPRTAFGTLAYVLGGASYVYIASHDEATGEVTYAHSMTYQ